MALRIAASLTKRLDALTEIARAKRCSVPGGVILFGTDELDARNERLFVALAELPLPKRGGYLLVPPILPADLWEQHAMEAQATLSRATAEWLDVEDPLPAEPTGKDPMDATGRYKESWRHPQVALRFVGEVQR